jgi:hypothetical protein
MSFNHPLGIEEIGYFLLNDVTVGWTWRAGCTSIIGSMEPYIDEVTTLTHPPESCILFLKNPLERFRSAWIAQPFIGVGGDGTPYRMSMNDYIDAVLDDTPGARSPHSNPQLWQHRRVKDIVTHKLEGSTHVCGVPLLHLNITDEEKPPIEHREDELYEYYERDIRAWEDSSPLGE